MTADTKTLAEWAVHERRYLHQYPELSGQEYQTAAHIRSRLQEWQLELLTCPAPSVVGLLRGTDGKKTIALRADIDALPVNEEGDKPYLSKHPGIAHVCGPAWRAGTGGRGIRPAPLAAFGKGQNRDQQRGDDGFIRRCANRHHGPGPARLDAARDD
ncbi:hypothetical protein BAG01nite_34260 [Brevibacillus agri]|uniref:Amidohydrolase n=1 Tax=Brevibacillus agri TaxID=51101 RepID=A0ABQ0STV7_9BACL|nr:hypothetical protein BAG01nite_34260 [Brevibacillus agri]